jgi:mRNA-degrading endonuclease RelE of RelBE toxin-antitoxin system
MAVRQIRRKRPAPKPVETTTKVRIGFTRSANEQFLSLPEKERTSLLAKLVELARNARLGKPLVGDLKGCVRISLGRLRCVAKCAAGAAVVLVLVIAKRAHGSRKDSYELAKRALATQNEEIQSALQAHVTAHLESLRKADAEMRRDR